LTSSALIRSHQLRYMGWYIYGEKVPKPAWILGVWRKL
jgi:hypothetical protein